MGFWSKLFGGKKVAKLDVNAVDRDGDGKVQDGTIWERPAEYTVNSMAKTIESAAADLAEVAVNIANGETPEEAAKRKRSEAAKKAAATRAKKAAEANKPAPTKKPAPKKSTGNGGTTGTAKKTR